MFKNLMNKRLIACYFSIVILGMLVSLTISVSNGVSQLQISFEDSQRENIVQELENRYEEFSREQLLDAFISQHERDRTALGLSYELTMKLAQAVLYFCVCLFVPWITVLIKEIGRRELEDSS
jgi:hypothetical protein